MIELQDAGLGHDLPTLRRRRLFGLAGGTTVAALAAAPVRSAAADSLVRSDIRRGFGKATGVAKGVPLSIKVQLISANSGRPVTGHAVYLWHCDRDGNYSLYSEGLAGENYLRGVQPTDSAGWVAFTSIFPAAYAGRWPHIHFEVYGSVAGATSAPDKLHTSQLALPADVCQQVYATTGYESSRKNLSQSSLGTDNVFKDGRSLEMASVTGDVQRGFVATRTVGI